MDTQSNQRDANAQTPVQLRDGNWRFGRYRDVQAALLDPRLSSQIHDTADSAARSGDWLPRVKNGVARLLKPRTTHSADAITRFHGHWLGHTDPPDHTRMRAAVLAPLIARVDGLVPNIRSRAEELVAQGRAAGAMEVGTALAYPLPIGVIGEMMGLPPAAQANLQNVHLSIASLMGGGPPQTPESVKTSLAIISYFEQLIAERRRHRTDDLVSDLITVQENGGLREEELVPTCIMLWVAGYESLHRLIVGGTYALLRHPEQFMRLKQEPEVVSLAIEELLRFVSSAGYVRRLVRTDMEMGGIRLERGERPYLSLFASNHDPEQFDNPDSFDITRKRNQHLALGLGQHLCIGARLARVEARIVFETLAQYAGELRLVDESVHWQLPAGFGSPANLWVKFG